MSFKLFIHHNAVEAIEQMCIAAKELKPNDPLIQSEDFKLVEPEISSTGDQFRSKPNILRCYSLSYFDVHV